jgi:hypothetical protein
MGDTNSELHDLVLNIVSELEAAADDRLIKVGSDYKIVDDVDEWKAEQYRKEVEKFKSEHPEASFDSEETGFDTYKEWMEDEIGLPEYQDDPDYVSLEEYVDDQSLGDVRFEVDSSKELVGGKVLFTYGGPNIWVHDDEVVGYWGSERVEMSLDSNARSRLMAYLEERWDAINP